MRFLIFHLPHHFWFILPLENALPFLKRTQVVWTPFVSERIIMFIVKPSFLIYGKTNFFEKRVSEYQKAGVLNKEEEQDKFSFDADF